MQVTAIHFRDDPILLGSPPMKPPRFHFGLPFRAATIWSNLEAAGVTDVTGAWQHVSQLMTVVALRRRYDGHAKRAGLVAAAHSYMARLVVVVDEDVDPSNLADVMWAVTTRCEPADNIDIIRQAWSSASIRASRPPTRTAASPHTRRPSSMPASRFPGATNFRRPRRLSAEEAREIEEKWGALLTLGPPTTRLRSGVPDEREVFSRLARLGHQSQLLCAIVDAAPDTFGSRWRSPNGKEVMKLPRSIVAVAALAAFAAAITFAGSRSDGPRPRWRDREPLLRADKPGLGYPRPRRTHGPQPEEPVGHLGRPGHADLGLGQPRRSGHAV